MDNQKEMIEALREIRDAVNRLTLVIATTIIGSLLITLIVITSMPTP